MSQSVSPPNGLNFLLAVTAVVANSYANLTDAENVVRQMLSQQIPAPAVQRAVANTVLILAPATAQGIRRISLPGLLISLFMDLLCHLLPVVLVGILRRQYRESKFPDRLAK